ncbi:unnamed protein product [Heterobilharzia americana]|nr:unnamed protein product [Heterobilharzia americana]
MNINATISDDINRPSNDLSCFLSSKNGVVSEVTISIYARKLAIMDISKTQWIKLDKYHYRSQLKCFVVINLPSSYNRNSLQAVRTYKYENMESIRNNKKLMKTKLNSVPLASHYSIEYSYSLHLHKEVISNYIDNDPIHTLI